MDEPLVAGLLDPGSIVTGAAAADWQEAVRLVGSVLVGSGAVTGAYVGLMLDREDSMSTYVGEGVAIPHGTLAGRDEVLRDSLAVVAFPDGVTWHDGNDVRLCIGIAACGEAHVPILATLAEILLDDDRRGLLMAATTAEEIHSLLTAPETADN